MRHCAKCGVDFAGELEVCPLCQAQLTGEATPSVFPRNEVKRSGALALRVLAFATGVAVLVLLFVGRMLALPGAAVLCSCLALLANYALVRHILASSPDFLRLVARYFIVLILVVLLWFALTGNLVFTTYVIPSICIVALVYDTVLMCVFKDTYLTGYAKYLLLDIVLGLASVALVPLGLTTWDVLAQVSGLVASVLLLGLVVFMRDRLFAELRKLFTA